MAYAVAELVCPDMVAFRSAKGDTSIRLRHSTPNRFSADCTPPRLRLAAGMRLYAHPMQCAYAAPNV
jgi:hypothetical protein